MMAGATKNRVLLLVVPNGVVMVMTPEATPGGATAPMVVLFVTAKLEAGIPLKLTAEAFVKLTPVILTIVPAAPLAGVKLVMLAGR